MFWKNGELNIVLLVVSLRHFQYIYAYNNVGIEKFQTVDKYYYI